MDTEAVLKGYIEAALFTESLEEGFAAEWNAQTGEDVSYDCSMQSHGFTADDLDADAQERMRADVESFCESEIPFTRAALEYWSAELGDEQIGHDFWLTRNHHGAGFWGRFSADPGASYGRQLSEQAQTFGDCGLYAYVPAGAQYGVEEAQLGCE